MYHPTKEKFPPFEFYHKIKHNRIGEKDVNKALTLQMIQNAMQGDISIVLCYFVQAKDQMLDAALDLQSMVMGQFSDVDIINAALLCEDQYKHNPNKGNYSVSLGSLRKSVMHVDKAPASKNLLFVQHGYNTGAQIFGAISVLSQWFDHNAEAGHNFACFGHLPDGRQKAPGPHYRYVDHRLLEKHFMEYLDK
jgi:hypothetical protein